MMNEPAAQFAHATLPVMASPNQMVSQLTRKERQVVDLVCRGMTNKQTARELGGISPHTVATHLRRAYVKLSVNSRAQLGELMAQVDRPA